MCATQLITHSPQKDVLSLTLPYQSGDQFLRMRFGGKISLQEIDLQLLQLLILPRPLPG
jgi:hypothetical protein